MSEDLEETRKALRRWNPDVVYAGENGLGIPQLVFRFANDRGASIIGEVDHDAWLTRLGRVDSLDTDEDLAERFRPPLLPGVVELMPLTFEGDGHHDFEMDFDGLLRRVPLAEVDAILEAIRDGRDL